MKEEQVTLIYTTFATVSELNEEDAMLVEKARKQTALAYAPYSNFKVSAMALMENGELVTGTNQENASYPVAICAERVLLGSVANLFPGMPIKTIALSYNSDHVKCDHPISPCGMCRQALAEYESRLNMPIRLLMTGQTGEVFLIKVASNLLPLAFSSLALNRHT